MGIQAVTLPRDAVVDGQTIELNESGELQTKNGGIAVATHSGAQLTAEVNHCHIVLSGTPQHEISQANGANFSSSDSTATDAGVKFSPLQACNLVSVTKHASSTVTTALLKSAAGATLDTASFVGNVATFASPVALVAGTTYRIEADAEGASYTRRFIADFVETTNTIIDWTGGSVNGSDNAAGSNILSMVIEEPTVEVLLPATAFVGEVFQVANPYGLYLDFTQGASQQLINVDGSASTAGAGGSATTNSTFVKLVCVVDNTTFLVVHTNATITLT